MHSCKLFDFGRHELNRAAYNPLLFYIIINALFINVHYNNIILFSHLLKHDCMSKAKQWTYEVCKYNIHNDIYPYKGYNNIIQYVKYATNFIKITLQISQFDIVSHNAKSPRQ